MLQKIKSFFYWSFFFAILTSVLVWAYSFLCLMNIHTTPIMEISYIKASNYFVEAHI